MPFDKTYKSLGKKPRDPELDELQDLQSGYLPTQINAGEGAKKVLQYLFGDERPESEFNDEITSIPSPIDGLAAAIGAKFAKKALNPNNVSKSINNLTKQELENSENIINKPKLKIAPEAQKTKMELEEELRNKYLNPNLSNTERLNAYNEAYKNVQPPINAEQWENIVKPHFDSSLPLQNNYRSLDVKKQQNRLKEEETNFNKLKDILNNSKNSLEEKTKAYNELYGKNLTPQEYNIQQNEDIFRKKRKEVMREKFKPKLVDNENTDKNTNNTVDISKFKKKKE